MRLPQAILGYAHIKYYSCRIMWVIKFFTSTCTHHLHITLVLWWGKAHSLSLCLYCSWRYEWYWGGAFQPDQLAQGAGIQSQGDECVSFRFMYVCLSAPVCPTSAVVLQISSHPPPLYSDYFKTFYQPSRFTSHPTYHTTVASLCLVS